MWFYLCKCEKNNNKSEWRKNCQRTFNRKYKKIRNDKYVVFTFQCISTLFQSWYDLLFSSFFFRFVAHTFFLVICAVQCVSFNEIVVTSEHNLSMNWTLNIIHFQFVFFLSIINWIFFYFPFPSFIWMAKNQRTAINNEMKTNCEKIFHFVCCKTWSLPVFIFCERTEIKMSKNQLDTWK